MGRERVDYLPPVWVWSLRPCRPRLLLIHLSLLLAQAWIFESFSVSFQISRGHFLFFHIFSVSFTYLTAVEHSSPNHASIPLDCLTWDLPIWSLNQRKLCATSCGRGGGAGAARHQLSFRRLLRFFSLHYLCTDLNI